METTEKKYVWLLNPAGRKIEAEAHLVPELLKKGFLSIGEEENIPELDQEFLEVIEL